MNIEKITSEMALPVGAFLICAFILYTIWKWASSDKPVVRSTAATNDALLELLTRIQLLDNDLARLNKKINVVIKQQEIKNNSNE